MKPFISAILLLISATSAQAETFYIAFASDPQFPWVCETVECKALAKTEEEQGILSNHWQAESINRAATRYGSEFKGVIVNGDLTAFGHKDELKGYRGHFANLIQSTIYPGLGNHDYANNVNDCFNNNCATRMMRFMDKEIDKLRKSGATIVSYDRSSRTNWKRTQYHTGSFAYSFDIGGVHFVQLHNYPSYTTTFETWTYSEARYNVFEIKSSFPWLEEDLLTARNLGKTIVVNLHDFGDHMSGDDQQKLLNLCVTYKVSAIFAGHNHSIHRNTRWSSKVPIYLSGSSSYNTYLVVQFENNQLKNVKTIKAVRGEYREIP